jgi:DNA-binding CsgD family transcriptional regulator
VPGEAAVAIEHLSPAERRVFDLALRGLATKEMADELVLSEATISSHLTRIYAKFGVQGRIELLAKMAGVEVALPDDPVAVAAASPPRIELHRGSPRRSPSSAWPPAWWCPRAPSSLGRRCWCSASL